MSPENSQATLNNFIREERTKFEEIIMEAKPGLPEGWKWIQLENIAFIRKGTINPLDFPEEEFELYSIPAYHTSGKPELEKGKEIKSSKVLVYSDDCLFGKLNPRVQKVWLVGASNNRRQIATTEFFPIVSKEKPNGEKWFLPEFIFLILKSPNIQERIVHKVLGTTASRQRLSPNDILEEKVPCPPLEEQKRIIIRVREIMSRIEQAKKLREEALKDTEAIMQSALDRVFVRLEAYSYKTLGELCAIRGGNALPSVLNRPETNDMVLLLRVDDMNNPQNLLYIQTSKEKIPLNHAKELNLRIIPEGSIIIPKRGGAIATNKKRILSFSAVLDPNLMGITVTSNCLDTKFLFYWFQRLDLQQITSGSTVPQLNKMDLEPLRVPIPPLEEQKSIVKYLDCLYERLDVLKKHQEETAEEIEAMTQTVLRKAFKGEF